MLFETTKQAVQQGEIEKLLSFDGPPDAMINVAGKVYLYFAGNGYLGLQAEPDILAATCEAALRYGVGTGTTRTSFTSPPVFEVEQRVAEMLSAEKALYTASGYAANQIVFETLEGTFDKIFIDENSHYSLFDAVKRNRGKRCVPLTFKHGDVAHLQEQLDGNLQFNEKPLVISDGVFSFLGTVAPVDEYLQLLENYEGASLWIDDAHGFGVLGEKGLGTLEHFGVDFSQVNLTPQDAADDFGFGNAEGQNTATRVFLSFSLSKAVGGCGGMIPGSETFIQRLKDRSSIYYGASAPPSPIAAATAKALSMLSDVQRRNQLRRNTAYLKAKLRKIGLSVNDSDVPIIVLTLGSSGNMRRIQKRLSEQGILISYLPRNTGLGSEGALRIAVFATHTAEMLNELTEELKKML
jgi:7-keto-8-aminopelargonate synthetase-like enzyme